MFSWLFGLKAEIRALNRDAAGIVRSTREGRSPATQAAMALATRNALRLAQEHAEQPGNEGKAVDYLKTLHREARRARQEVFLTGYTFAIIHTRASEIGEHTLPARTCIEDFLADWSHVDEPQEPETHIRF
jgi:hypothetical protein